MGKEQLAGDERAARRPQAPDRSQGKEPSQGPGPTPAPLATLQQRVGNRAVQRLLAQRAAQAPTELDEETASRINRARGGGQPLDSSIGKELGAALGHDLGGVRVHTSPEADSLSRSLQARAFTTGRDVFFRSGAYEPQSSSGRQLIAHELAHVVQQSAGAVSSGERMAVNPPGDLYEQEAEGVAEALAGGTAARVQRQVEEEEEESVQAQTEEEEEESVQAQTEEEEEPVQAQFEEEEEEQLP
ncbi:MAG: DUF4157 domain-containing protein [Anaerolineae bacterium]|nr:DUF4157 domain-containing protein [Anaerolineae bacterium]